MVLIINVYHGLAILLTTEPFLELKENNAGKWYHSLLLPLPHLTDFRLNTTLPGLALVLK